MFRFKAQACVLTLTALGLATPVGAAREVIPSGQGAATVTFAFKGVRVAQATPGGIPLGGSKATVQNRKRFCCTASNWSCCPPKVKAQMKKKASGKTK